MAARAAGFRLRRGRARGVARWRTGSARRRMDFGRLLRRGGPSQPLREPPGLCLHADRERSPLEASCRDRRLKGGGIAPNGPEAADENHATSNVPPRYREWPGVRSLDCWTSYTSSSGGESTLRRADGTNRDAAMPAAPGEPQCSVVGLPCTLFRVRACPRFRFRPRHRHNPRQISVVAASGQSARRHRRPADDRARLPSRLRRLVRIVGAVATDDERILEAVLPSAARRA